MIFKLIFVLTIYSSIAQCCSVYDIDESESNLNSAKTIILGAIKKTGDEQYFISKKPWKSIKFKLFTAPCGGFLFENDEYLIFSSNKSIDELVKLKSIDVSDGSFSKVKFSSDRVRDLLDKEELPEGQPNYFWKYCSLGSSCVDVIGRCGERVGINKNNQKNFENYLKKNKNYKCESSTRKKSSCINNFCS